MNDEQKVILHMLPTLDRGGGQALVLRWIAAGSPRFRHIVCHVRGPGTMAGSFYARGVATHSLEVRCPATQPAALSRLLRLIRRERIDLIHTNNTIPDLRLGMTAAAVMRKPVVNTLHTEEVIGIPRSPAAHLEAALIHGVARLALKRAVAVSESAREAWQPRLAAMGLSAGGVEVVSPGVEVPDLGPEVRKRIRAALGLSAEQPVLVHVGRLVRSKGQVAIINVLPALLKRWPDLMLLLVGDGPERQSLEEAAASAGAARAVRFLGGRDDVAALLAASDLFVFPSQTEGFGLAPLEALASGLPVVAFDLPTLRRFVLPGKTGVLVPQGDCEALARAVDVLLADPNARADLSRQGRALVAGCFDARASSLALEKVYQDVLSSRPLIRRTHDRRVAYIH